MPHCRHCGFPLENQAACPKCQASREEMGRNAMYEVDVAHNGESWDVAEKMIVHALDQTIYGHFKGLRVIHGYGSFSGQSVIAPRAISLMRHLAETHGGRFAKDNSNPGVSLIWLNKAAGNPAASSALIYSHETKRTAPKSADNWFDQALKKKF